MEQGERLDSTLMPQGQDVEHSTTDNTALDAAAARLLTAPAEPAAPDVRALVAYSSWLYNERAHLCREMYPHLGWKASSFIVGDNSGFEFHKSQTPLPSTRALSILSKVGCDWSQDGYLGIGFEPSTAGAPHSDRFPHPDAHLLDLGDAFFAAHAKHVECAAETKAAHSIYERHLKDHEDEDRPLLIKPGKYLDYWSGEAIRKILAGRYHPTRIEVPLVDAKSRADWERLLPLAEARDGRVKEALDACGYEALAERDDEILQDVDAAAEAVFRLRAKTFEGIELKARVAKATDPHLWNRPGFFEKIHGEWHEYALTEIADSVSALLAQGRAKPADEVKGNLFADLTAISGGVVGEDGIVCFTDATGKLLYEPVAKWVAMTATRLHHVARTELARQISDPTLEPSARRDLDRRLRQEMRTDAIEALAFRPTDAFKIADAERHGRLDATPPPSRHPLGAVSPELTRAMEAHRETQQLMLHDPDMDDARFEAGGGRLADAEAALLAVPSRSLADLRHKLIYLWPGSLEDHIPNPRLRAMFENFREDFDGLCSDAASADAEFLALAPVILPLLDRHDEQWAKTKPLYEEALASIGTAKYRDKLPLPELYRREQEAFVATGYRDAYDAASLTADEIIALVEKHMDTPATTLDGIVLKSRVGATFKQYDEDAGADVDRLMKARFGDVGGTE